MISTARIFGAILALTLLFAHPVPAALAQAAPYCAPGVSPTFSQGFAALKENLGDIMGEPVECEHTETGPRGQVAVIQETTTGFAFWQKSNNVAAFTNGQQHWALTSRGLVTWTGNSVDPPPNARVVEPPASSGSRGISTSGRTEAAAVPPIGAGRRLTPDQFTFRTIDAAPASEGWPCQSRNPSCGREEWWAQWNELQDSAPIQYRYIGPGLVTEARFEEAVALLWLWPDGRELLQIAAGHGVQVTSSPQIARRAFAAYQPATRSLLVNPSFTEVSTWMLADVLAHELRHAADHATGTRMGSGYEDCIAREQAAFHTEADFVRWLADRQGGLPSSEQVSKLLSQEDFALFTDVYRTLTSQNLDAQVEESYRAICSRSR